MARSVLMGVIFAALVAEARRASRFAWKTMNVKIDNFTFARRNITVPAGTTVTWTNRDDIPHTVVSTDKAFKSRCSIPTRAILVHVHQRRGRSPTSARSIRR